MDFVKLAALLTVLEKARQFPTLHGDLHAAAFVELEKLVDEARKKKDEKKS